MSDEKLDIVTTDTSFGEFCSKGRERNGEGELETEVREGKEVTGASDGNSFRGRCSGEGGH